MLTAEELEVDRVKAIDIFRAERIEEPLEEYLKAFDDYSMAVRTLLKSTRNLADLEAKACDVLTKPNLLVACRYLASPAVSEDDLKVLADARLSPTRLQADEEMARRVIRTILSVLDPKRFPWVHRNRPAEDDELAIAINSTAALIATRRVMTDRANGSKNDQEGAVADFLESVGFREVATRTISNLSLAPRAGEYCKESIFGSRKADLTVGLWDGRHMPLECKVSNSSTNSIKRLNNDAAVKAKIWLREFGTAQIIPAAMLAGVFKLRNLQAAQQDGLALFWAHDLEALARFIESTR
ncbi:XamI family restriction endonuclease [Nonomuraea sp. LP-02]|uniref:XamI family restriction endonuclease n=1 Tax=Nonomuraea sp. LP-02 TaxID=3097960 RepID=UPI002E31B4B7|nr:XamI family restriction endonuclease [Nonomuraea sp. LP-02]MED7930418.1 XamI family restriction endonuclease [Nonomuraea sp. LP-02]